MLHSELPPASPSAFGFFASLPGPMAPKANPTSAWAPSVVFERPLIQFGLSGCHGCLDLRRVRNDFRVHPKDQEGHRCGMKTVTIHFGVRWCKKTYCIDLDGFGCFVISFDHSAASAARSAVHGFILS